MKTFSLTLALCLLSVLSEATPTPTPIPWGQMPHSTLLPANWYITGGQLVAPGGSGSSTFIGLSDVPNSYSGQGLKQVRVNAGATGLEFAPTPTATATSTPTATATATATPTPSATATPTATPDVDDTAYNATTWDGVTTIAPSKNAVRDKIESMGGGGIGGSIADQQVAFGNGTDITGSDLLKWDSTNNRLIVLSDGLGDAIGAEVGGVLMLHAYDGAEADVATAGDLRVTSSFALKARNGDGDGNIDVLTVGRDGSYDYVQIGLVNGNPSIKFNDVDQSIVTSTTGTVFVDADDTLYIYGRTGGIYLNDVFFFDNGGIIGTTTNDNATTGNVGEEIESLVASGSAVSLTTNTAANITSISLTAGDWDVEGTATFTETTSTVSARTAGIGVTSATLPTDGSEAYCGVQSTLTSELNSITLSRKRISLAAPATIYLVAKASFSAGTVASFGVISARRPR